MAVFELDDLLAPDKRKLSVIVDIQSYVDEDCVKCGRHRVELITVASGNKYHICEKCGWIRELNRHLENLTLHSDKHIDETLYDEEGKKIKDVNDYLIAEGVYGE